MLRLLNFTFLDWEIGKEKFKLGSKCDTFADFNYFH